MLCDEPDSLQSIFLLAINKTFVNPKLSHKGTSNNLF